MIHPILNIITDFINGKIPGILGLYLFGSFAEHTETSNSDIDIAFLTYSKISNLERWKIQEALASLLDKDVDLVDLKDATTILRAEVVEKGIRFFTANTYECDYFEMVTYSMYADLNESRMEMVEELKAKYGRNNP